MVNRRHIFPNGNKRLSTLRLLTFLIGNDTQLEVSPQELTEKALWLATAEADDFPAIKAHLVSWIEGHLIEAAVNK
jgi:prophage maintenance system killer protein